MSQSNSSPVICITQARIGSSRLPGKVLLPILGKPMLWWHLSRLQRARRLDGLVVATTREPGAERIAEIAAGLGVPVFHGSEQDVLGRFAGAAGMANAATVVRVTSDCPLIDPELVDALVAAYLARDAETCAYMRIDTDRLPRGLDAEIFSRRALEAAAREAVDPYEREHVTPFIWSRGQRFGAEILAVDRVDETYRLCVDEPADFALVERIIGALAPTQPDFGLWDIVAQLRAQPDWAKLNAHVTQKSAPATFAGP